MVFDRIRGIFWKGRKKPDAVFARQQPGLCARLEDIHALQLLPKMTTDGRIDTIGTDHCADTLVDKRGENTIWTARSSFPGTHMILPLMLSEGYHKRGISLQRIAELTAYNAANIFNLYPKKGTIMVGSDADLVIVDLNLERTVEPSLFQDFSGYSLFDGWKVKGWPVMTLLRGEVIVKAGKVIAKESHGKYLPRNQFLSANF